jgi:hypothetical protein
MNGIILIIFALIMVSTQVLCQAQMIGLFSSTEDLANHADWIGVIRIKNRVLPENAAGMPNVFLCEPLVSKKGEGHRKPAEHFMVVLASTSARVDRNGVVLEALSRGSDFNPGSNHFVFLKKHGERFKYVPVEGSVLEIPIGFSIENIRSLSVQKAFERVIVEQEIFFQSQAKHARLQRLKFLAEE